MQEEKLKISVVNYTNSLPFVFGLEHYSGEKKFEVEKDIPSVCAQKLIDNKVDIGLIPVAVIPQLKESHLVSEYCIGAEGAVGSVLLLSEVPLQEIQTILLDFHSRTSVQLVQLLATHFWKINPDWKKADTDFISEIAGPTAAVVIGDRTFALKNKFEFAYDLSEEWKKFTGLPFVFAAWVANKKLPTHLLDSFTKAIQFGMEQKQQVIEELKKQQIPNLDAAYYLNKSIQFELDKEKKKGMDLFLSYLK